MTKRIWELDALRGICILGMVVFHLLYDLNITLPLPLQLLQLLVLITLVLKNSSLKSKTKTGSIST